MMYVHMLKYQCHVVFVLRSFAHDDILRLLINNQTKEQVMGPTCVCVFSSDRDYAITTCILLAA